MEGWKADRKEGWNRLRIKKGSAESKEDGRQ